MMPVQLKPMSEVNHQAIQLLSQQIGIVDTIRFVNQFTTGHGNYTEQREALFDSMTLEDIVESIEKARCCQPLPKHNVQLDAERPVDRG